MNRIIKICSLLIYVFFAQIYPVAHCHTQENHGDGEHRLAVHPEEFHLDTFDHHDDDPLDTHQHKNAHLNGDWNYIVQAKTFQSSISEKAIENTVISSVEPATLYGIIRNKQQNIQGKSLPLSSSNRAPPNII